MTKPKGGRGKKAPYQTKLMRVPVPMKTQVLQLVDRYQIYLDSGGDALNPPMLLGDSESLHGSKPKGGRGKKAPYTAKLMRVPVPIANQVNQLIDRYFGYLSSGGLAAEPPLLLGEAKLINSLGDKSVTKLAVKQSEKVEKIVNSLESKPVNDLADSNRERISE
ncbi:MAG: hypothetical protein AB4038_03460, partial [Prochloraceae cyanobacterium]